MFQSTHSLRSATRLASSANTFPVFQSTHSLRSATKNVQAGGGGFHVSIHALLAECDLNGNSNQTLILVSIHALLAECDLNGNSNQTLILVSIHALLAECDLNGNSNQTLILVSIHALLAECDGTHLNRPYNLWGFNPRTPCGVRRTPCSAAVSRKTFQSTHSLRSATENSKLRLPIKLVSIHALLAECDP